MWVIVATIYLYSAVAYCVVYFAGLLMQAEGPPGGRRLSGATLVLTLAVLLANTVNIATTAGNRPVRVALLVITLTGAAVGQHLLAKDRCPR